MKKYILPVIILLVAVAGYFLFSSGGEEEKIRETLKILCRMGSKSKRDNPAASALLISKTDRIFTEKFSVNINKGMFDGEYTPTAMTQDLARYRAIFSNVKVDFQDLEIFFPEKHSATVLFTGVINGNTKQGKSISEARDVECRMEKKDKDWKISRLIIREVLER